MTGLQIEKSRLSEQIRHNLELEDIERGKLSETSRSNRVREGYDNERLKVAWYDSKSNRDNVWFNHQDRMAQIQQRYDEVATNVKLRYDEIAQQAFDRQKDREQRQWEAVHNFETNRDRNYIEWQKAHSNSIWNGSRLGMSLGTAIGGIAFGPAGAAIGAVSGQALGGLSSHALNQNNTYNMGGMNYGKTNGQATNGGRSW